VEVLHDQHRRRRHHLQRLPRPHRHQRQLRRRRLGVPPRRAALPRLRHHYPPRPSWAAAAATGAPRCQSDGVTAPCTATEATQHCLLDAAAGSADAAWPGASTADGWCDGTGGNFSCVLPASEPLRAADGTQRRRTRAGSAPMQLIDGGPAPAMCCAGERPSQRRNRRCTWRSWRAAVPAPCCTPTPRPEHCSRSGPWHGTRASSGS
jgi:hypothetical protein